MAEFPAAICSANYLAEPAQQFALPKLVPPSHQLTSVPQLALSEFAPPSPRLRISSDSTQPSTVGDQPSGSLKHVFSRLHREDDTPVRLSRPASVFFLQPQSLHQLSALTNSQCMNVGHRLPSHLVGKTGVHLPAAGSGGQNEGDKDREGEKDDAGQMSPNNAVRTTSHHLLHSLIQRRSLPDEYSEESSSWARCLISLSLLLLLDRSLPPTMSSKDRGYGTLSRASMPP